MKAIKCPEAFSMSLNGCEVIQVLIEDHELDEVGCERCVFQEECGNGEFTDMFDCEFPRRIFVFKDDFEEGLYEK